MTVAQLVDFQKLPQRGQLTYINVKGKGRTLVKVVKLNQVNYVAQAEDGGQYNVPIRSWKGEAPAGTVFKEAEANPDIHLGSHAVFVEGSLYSRKESGSLLFVSGYGNLPGTWRVSVVGNTKGLYYRDVPSSQLKRVEVRIVGA